MFSVDTDHLLFSNRSFAYLVLGRHQEALQDAETVIHLKPDWPKVRAFSKQKSFET